MPDVQAMIPGFPQNLSVRYGTIKNGASETEFIATDGMAPVAISMPAAWTAADLGYKASWDGSASQICFSQSGNAETTVAVANSWILFPVQDSLFAPFLKVTSVAAGGQSVTPVTQGADRQIIVLFRRFLS